VLRGVINFVTHRKVQEPFERKPLQSLQGNSATVWERETLRFHGICQIFGAALFFAAIRFRIFLMKLTVLTVGHFNSVGPVLIVLNFMTGA
jgi:hypothetical protein